MKRFFAWVLIFLCLAPEALAFNFIERHGSRDEKKICITVDDCTDTPMLQAIFDLSQEMEIPITFFTLGYSLKDEDRDLWRAIAESNCEIGNHTYPHYRLPETTAKNIIRRLERTQERLDEVMGYHYPMQVMRPPFGKVNKNGSSRFVSTAVKKAGYAHIVLWDVSQNDPVKCMKAVKNGSILLFHTIKKDLKCLTEIIPQLKEQGYEMVTVSEMFGLEKPQIQYPE